MLLAFKQSTPNIMIYAELGITPLSLSIQNRILNFCARIINGKPDKISVILQSLFLNFIRETIYQSPWITYVQSSRDKVELSDTLRFQTVNNSLAFKNSEVSYT